MFDHCGKLISMISEDVHAVLLYYEHESRVTNAKFECTVEIWGYFDGGGLSMHFDLFNTSSSKTYIEIRQGDSWNEGRPIQGMPGNLSSTTFRNLDEVYTSDWMSVFIRVSGSQTPYRKRIFDMAVNHYHPGKCKSCEKSCDNGRCIDDTLQCIGYNPCGDFSDCNDDSVGLITEVIGVICVGTVAGLTCIVTSLSQCFKWRTNNRRRGKLKVISTLVRRRPSASSYMPSATTFGFNNTN